MATPSEARRFKRVLIYLEPDMIEAIERWADDEDRTRSAQVRSVLSAAIPEQYVRPEAPA